MRRTLIVLLVILSVAPRLPARNKHDWENARKLKPGSQVEMWLWNEKKFYAEIEEVSDAGMRVVQVDNVRGTRGPLREIDRAAIRKIATLYTPHLPNSRRWMLTGALAGGAIGLTSGAVSDAKNGGNYHWFEGAAGGAALGFFTSCAALGAIGIVDVARGVHRRKIIYESYGSLQLVIISQVFCIMCVRLRVYGFPTWTRAETTQASPCLGSFYVTCVTLREALAVSRKGSR